MHGSGNEPPSLCGLYAIFIRVTIVREKTPEMTKRRTRCRGAASAAVALITLAIGSAHCAAPPARACRRVEILGEVGAGQEWKAALGQGWVFRVLPIASSPAGYSG